MTEYVASNPLCRAMSAGKGRLPCKLPAPATAAQVPLLVALAILIVLLPIPSSAQDSWTATSRTGAPTARTYHTAVWTGSKMVVWGGQGAASTRFNTGGVYDPAANVWTATSTTGAPTARNDHTAVWTGSKMIVWGGFSGDATGGIYEPSTDTWAATSTVGAPSRRFLHTAVWTGSEMIVWGGEEIATAEATNTGAIYDPAANTWRATSTVGVPSARSGHAAVWTGSKMVVWGGGGGSGSTDTGGIYDPATDTWAPTSTVGVPSPRGVPTAVWTGSKMIVWGGQGASGTTDTGGVYDPVANVWTATNTTGAPSARQFHRGVWTGSRVIVWGGNESFGGANLDTGGVYDAVAGTWSATTTVGAPTARWFHTAVWTGSQMVVWGGSTGWDPSTAFDTGGIYFDPALLPPPTEFYTVTPCRLVDTRNPESPTGGPALAAGSIRSFPVTGGVCGIPSTASAVSVNLTAVGAAAPGHLILYPGDAVNGPLVSNVNFTTGVTRANNAVVPLATDGTGAIKVKNGSVGAVHFVLDVNGYFQ